MQLRNRRNTVRSGIALIMVLMVITVLGLLAFGFAKSMAVETKLARNENFGPEEEWLGRSGVEFARYVLSQHMLVPNDGSYDALNQFWAGGPMATNDALGALSLQDNTLGNGSFSVKIIDLERYYNINVADDVALRLAMTVIGVDATEVAPAVDGILDWRDTDDNTLLNGAESDYYMSQSPPYMPKNGPIDDLDELLRVHGVTPLMYYGMNGSNGVPTGALPSGGTMNSPNNTGNNDLTAVPYAVGLKDLFTPISARLINVNTASQYVLQLVPGIDATTAQAIVTTRSGPDGVEGNEDDMPFHNVNELGNVPGMDPRAVGNLSRVFTTRSATFLVTVTTKINNHEKQMVAILHRNEPRDVRILLSYWK